MLNFIKLFITMNIFFGSSVAFADAAEPWQLGFQDPATPAMEGIISFHNDIMFFLTVIAIFVTWLLGRCLYIYDEKRSPVSSIFVHSTVIEIVWTIVPAFVLLIVAPSLFIIFDGQLLIQLLL